MKNMKAKPAKEKRSVMVCFRLNPEDAKKLKASAKTLKMSRSDTVAFGLREVNII